MNVEKAKSDLKDQDRNMDTITDEVVEDEILWLEICMNVKKAKSDLKE